MEPTTSFTVPAATKEIAPPQPQSSQHELAETERKELKEAYEEYQKKMHHFGHQPGVIQQNTKVAKRGTALSAKGKDRRMSVSKRNRRCRVWRSCLKAWSRHRLGGRPKEEDVR